MKERIFYCNLFQEKKYLFSSICINLRFRLILQVDEREPAEAEVKAVMQVCSGCTPEPFKKALVLSWRSTSKKLYSGAHYYKGLPICRAF